MKEFVIADDDEKKILFSQLEEEVHILKGSAARFEWYHHISFSVLVCLSFVIWIAFVLIRFVLFCFRHGNLYLKLMKSSMEKGENYAKNEIQRLEGMLRKVIY